MPLNFAPWTAARLRASVSWLLAGLATVLVLLVAPGAASAVQPVPYVQGWGSSLPFGSGEVVELGEEGSEEFAVNGSIFPLTTIPEAATPTAAAVGGSASYVLTSEGVLGAGFGFTGFGYDSIFGSGFVLIPETAGAKAVATGNDATLIVQADGTVVGFGANQHGSRRRHAWHVAALAYVNRGLDQCHRRRLRPLPLARARERRQRLGLGQCPGARQLGWCRRWRHQYPGPGHLSRR